MNVCIVVYRPPTGVAPEIGDKMRSADGERAVIEIVEVRDNGEYLLRLEKADCD